MLAARSEVFGKGTGTVCTQSQFTEQHPINKIPIVVFATFFVPQICGCDIFCGDGVCNGNATMIVPCCYDVDRLVIIKLALPPAPTTQTHVCAADL